MSPPEPHFDLVIACDWSAAVGRKPEPREDRCWLAWATKSATSDPVYCPTRREAEAEIRAVLDAHTGARTLVGFDFAIGYPTAEDGSHVLPTGRELCGLIADMVTDDASGANNRFEVAAELNRRICEQTGAQSGPFWGRPTERPIEGLPATRPANTGVNKLRACEVAARKATRTKPKSPWQLTGAGAVGGQSLMGLPTVHRLLSDYADAALWPFEDGSRVTIAEIYPSMFPQHAPKHWYKDARQVTDACEALIKATPTKRTGTGEGWIFGLPSSVD